MSSSDGSSRYDDPGLFFDQFTALQGSLGASASLDGVIEWWESGCSIGRDVSCKTGYPKFPDQQIAFAGDMSWGDSPDGFGYQMFDFIDCLDWWGLLGIY